MSPAAKSISVMVLDDPGLMRESLRTLLSTVPRVQVSDMVTLPGIHPHWIVEQCPDCIIVEIPDGPSADGYIPFILKEVKQALPKTRCLIIAHSPNHACTYLDAGADYVLMKGFAFGELKQAFDLLFN